LINLRATLEKITPELEKRLRNSHLHGWTGDVLLAMPKGQVGLSIARTRINVVKPTQTKHRIEGGQEIAQLILGCEDPYETVQHTGISLRGDAETLIGVLFPWQQPMMGDEAF